MGALALESLNVLVTGIEASHSRDVVRLFSAQGASVMAADGDARKLSRLERDVALYRAKVEAAPINIASASELRLFEDNLRLLGRLPHLMICCCPAHGAGRRGGSTKFTAKAPAECVGALAARILQPSLFLHLEAGRPGIIGRALSVLAHPTLLAVLERKPGRGVFDPDAFTPYVRIAAHVYSLRRQQDVGAAAPDGAVTPFPPARRKRRPGTQPPAPQANAA
ncbi:MAG: hypothetical protein JSR86_17935 [Proteobacteria bacterium]|nr:hypothetical protein [Pseudomonadota bacterium]